jgi:hypothetical protein
MQLIHILSDLEDSLLALIEYQRLHPDENIDGRCMDYGIKERIAEAKLC